MVVNSSSLTRTVNIRDLKGMAGHLSAKSYQGHSKTYAELTLGQSVNKTLQLCLQFPPVLKGIGDIKHLDELALTFHRDPADNMDVGKTVSKALALLKAEDDIKTLERMLQKELERVLLSFDRSVRNMSNSARDAVKELRATADYLDKVWKDCRIAHTAGTSTSIVGGILSVAGGILTFLTAGAASPVLIAGIAVSAAGGGTTLGTAVVEKAINSCEVEKADEALAKLWRDRQEVKKNIEELQSYKSEFQWKFIKNLAVELALDKKALNLLTTIVPQNASWFSKSGETGAAAAAETGTQTSAKLGSMGAKAFGGLVIGVSTVFIVLDAVLLSFTVKDLVEDKGSDAAKLLREKALEIEANQKNF